MDMDAIRLFETYNRAVNRNLEPLLLGLGPEDWAREFGGYFSSIRSLCNHLYISDFTWLKRFSGLRAFSYAASPLLSRDLAFGTTVYGTAEAFVAARRDLDALMGDFIGEVTVADLGASLRYKDSSGTPHEKNFGGLILHLFNHGTHHRGMISLYLEEVGVANDVASLSAIL